MGSNGWRKEIEDLRVRIDATDRQLLEALGQRARYVLEIGKVKSREGLPVYDPTRERMILEKIRRLNPGPLTDEAVARLFERIIDESRALERKNAECGMTTGRARLLPSHGLEE